ncbi:MAG: S1 RNA-binding domain-containing protein [Anaerolineales bacterium]|nr:S1 RNA-binding domain-containing protein [Anaerolineales bacterium]
MSDVTTAPELEKKTKITGRVIKVTLAGAIVDIGQEQPAVLHISQLGEEPVKKVEDVLEEGQEVEAWIRRVDKRTGRVELTLIEPLDLEWREIKKGMVVSGTVTRLENFGAFIDIGAERPGLAHISELTRDYIRSVNDVLTVGDEVEAKVLDVNRRKRQIKLSLKALQVEEIEEDEEEEVNNVPAPTAMELALRKAMDQVDEEVPAEKAKNKKSGNSDEIENLLARTLENRK